jgi:HEAT repeat protein
MNEVTPHHIVDCIINAWQAGDADEAILQQLSTTGLCKEAAEQALALVRSGYFRAALLRAGMKLSQFSSDFEDDPIFQAALQKGQAALANLPPRKTPTAAELEAAVADTDVEKRRRAVYDLGETKSSRAVPLLLAALHDADTWVRVYAIQALGVVRSRRAIAALSRLLQSEADELVLGNIIRALVRIGDKGAVPALVAATRHPNAFIRHDAAWALGELRDKRATAALEALFGDMTIPEARDENGLLTRSSIYRVSDHARMALRKLRPWWRFW